jgi:hypothetical protein
MRKNQKLFFVEVTDTFSGEANYSWVTRHKIAATSYRGAACVVAKNTGIGWHKVCDYGDMARYDSESGATCFFIEEYDEDSHGRYFQ